MHIALDARMMGVGKTRGIGRVIEEMVKAMLEVDHEVRFTLVVRALTDSSFVDHPRVDHVVADIPWYSLKEQMQMARVLEDIRADLIHVPHWNVPLRLCKPFVLTVHDLLLLRQPASAKASTRGFFVRTIKHAAFQLVLKYALKNAERIFVPTKFVAEDVERLGKILASRIRVVGEGVTTFSNVDSSLCPTAPYLLYVGSAYPHKRLDVLIKGWKELSVRHPQHELVIVGEKDVFMERYVMQVEAEKIPRVRFLGRVTDAQLGGLYQKAHVFVFPSSHEGFGLPPLEALSLGCPVVASDISCLREVLPNEGVEWFREGDSRGMIHALERTLYDVAHAKERVRKEQSEIRRRHDWKMSAKAVVEGYRVAIEQK